MYFTMYRDNQNQWRWNLKSGNHEIIAHGESYKNKQDCRHTITLVKSSSSAIVYKPDGRGGWKKSEMTPRR